MEKLTPEEFSKRYGADALAKFNIPKKETPKPSMLQNISNDLKARGSNFVGDIKEMAGGKINPAEFGVRSVGQAIGGVGDIFGDVLAPVIKPVLEPILSTSIGQAAVHSLKAGKDVYDEWKTASPENARAAKDIESVINIASIFPVGKKAQVAGNVTLKAGKMATAKTVKSLSDINTGLKTQVKTTLNKVANSDIVSPIEPGMRKELAKSTSPELNKYLNIAKEGAIDYSKPSALDTVGEIGASAAKKMKEQLGLYGKQIGGVPKLQAGYDMKNSIGSAITELKSAVKDRAGMIINNKGILSSSPGRLGKLTSEEVKLITFVNGKLQTLSKNPNFEAVDDFVNSVQKELFDKTSNMLIAKNSNAEGIIKGVISKVNGTLKDISPSSKRFTYSNAKYSEIKETYDQLNKLLGSKGKNGGALMKRVFSPHDAGTKKLFEKVKAMTGIDLIKESTLAKYAMEKLGDARSASLLEQMQMLRGGGKAGMIEKSSQFIIG